MAPTRRRVHTKVAAEPHESYIRRMKPYRNNRQCNSIAASHHTMLSPILHLFPSRGHGRLSQRSSRAQPIKWMRRTHRTIGLLCRTPPTGLTGARLRVIYEAALWTQSRRGFRCASRRLDGIVAFTHEPPPIARVRPYNTTEPSSSISGILRTMHLTM
jgi:hypothetical protein